MSAQYGVDLLTQKKVNINLNETCAIVRGYMKSTPIENLYEDACFRPMNIARSGTKPLMVVTQYLAKSTA